MVNTKFHVSECAHLPDYFGAPFDCCADGCTSGPTVRMQAFAEPGARFSRSLVACPSHIKDARKLLAAELEERSN